MNNDITNAVLESIKSCNNYEHGGFYPKLTDIALEVLADSRDVDNTLKRLKRAGKVKYIKGEGAGWVVIDG